MNYNITKEKAIEIATELIKDDPPYPIVSVTAILQEDYGVWAVMFTVDDSLEPAHIIVNVDLDTGDASHFVTP
jgi:hypothetical protein